MDSAKSVGPARHEPSKKVHRPVGATALSGTCASFIGRIGALAMALGVGAAVAGVGGVAGADDTAGASAASAAGQDSSSTGSAAGSGPGASAPSEAQAPARDPASPSVDSAGDHSPRVSVDGADADADADRRAEQSDALDIDCNPGLHRASEEVPAIEQDAPVPEVTGSSQDTDAEPVETPHGSAPRRAHATSTTVTAQPISQPSEVAADSAEPDRQDLNRGAVANGWSSVPAASAPKDVASEQVVAPRAVAASGLSEATPRMAAAPAVNSIGQAVFGTLGALGVDAATGGLPGLPLQVLLAGLDLIRREIEGLLDNGSPTLAYDANANVLLADGRIVGDLQPSDQDTTDLVYTATDPAHGEVAVDALGHFVYTPEQGYVGVDSFDVTVSDVASGFHIHGLPGLLNALTFGLLGDGGHAFTQHITVGPQREVLVSGLDEPTDFRFLPDGRILIAEKGGQIKVYDTATGTVQAESLITLQPNTAWGRGLLGLEVDPLFADNGFIYVAYVEDQSTQKYERVSRLMVTDPSAEVLTVDPSSEVVLLQGDQPADDGHLGGVLRFGPDQKLYWAVGNNDFTAPDYPPDVGQDPTSTNSADTTNLNNAQELSNIYGKIVRLDPDGGAPTDNPFFDPQNPDSYTSYIYAYGLRNPFRMAFTPSGELLVADVGQNTWEELNNVTAGGNYGYPLAEGPCDGVGTPSCSTPSAYENPIYYYQHIGVLSSLTSVLAYTGTAYGSDFTGQVLVADFDQGWIKALTCDAGYSSCTTEHLFDPGAGPTVSLAQGPDGFVYQLILADPANPYDSPGTGELARYV